jgi:hypothetical protein
MGGKSGTEQGGRKVADQFRVGKGEYRRSTVVTDAGGGSINGGGLLAMDRIRSVRCSVGQVGSG